jgi:hypothetical protein
MAEVEEVESSRHFDILNIAKLSEISEKVGRNTSDIEKLKEQTSVLDGLKMDVAELKQSQENISLRLEKLDQNDIDLRADVLSLREGQNNTNSRLDKLDENDSKIETGIVKFRYYLGTFIVLIFTCIFGTLAFGLRESRSDQSDLRELLEIKIEASDRRHEANYKNISNQIIDMKNILLETKPKISIEPK